MGFDPVTLAMANSYTDSQRLAYIETKRETAINPFTIPAGKQDVRGPGFSSVKDNIIDGAKYIVTIGGVPHKTNCFEDDGYYYIGNGAIMPDISAGEDTGESFGCRLFDRGSTSARSEFYLTDTVSEDTTVTVELITETIHPIDPKYIPWDSAPGGSGGGLPVVELNTKVNLYETLYLSEAENKTLDDIWTKNMPCIISLGVDGMDDVLMSTFVRRSDVIRDYRSFSGFFYHVMAGFLVVCVENNNEDGWHVYVSMFNLGA